MYRPLVGKTKNILLCGDGLGFIGTNEQQEMYVFASHSINCIIKILLKYKEGHKK